MILRSQQPKVVPSLPSCPVPQPVPARRAPRGGELVRGTLEEPYSMGGQDGGGSHDALMGAVSALDAAAQGWIYVDGSQSSRRGAAVHIFT